ncbi:hypothetical protein JQC70_22170 [Burkholderia contaminans]|uniref:hypothetical protein n=1 Tax=Burkholderia TaxID=32008 RepID=UPI0010F9DB92|nr:MULTISPECIES: hypothetical protein [Burkholderia]MBM6427864.1 hypothetical protein [Burkholderia contaminans]
MSLKEKFAELKHVVGNALHYADPTALIEKATQALIESLVDTVHALQERVEVLEQKLADTLAQIPSAEQTTTAATLVDANVGVAQEQPATAGAANGDGAAGELSAGSSTSATGPSGDAPAVAQTGESTTSAASSGGANPTDSSSQLTSSVSGTDSSGANAPAA